LVIVALLLFAQVGTIQFRTTVSRDTVYVGQQVTYDGITLVDDIARTRLAKNPEYTPAEVQGATIYDFPFDTAAITTVRGNGLTFRRFVFRRAFFPLTPGEYDVPPAMLQYSLPESDGFYSERRQFTQHSAAAKVVAIALPTNGKPLDFTGVVGQFVDTMYTDGSRFRVGDGITVTIRVSGVGNVLLLPRPALKVDWADVVPGEERATWDSTGSVVRGAKEFDWVVTPRVAGELFIPEVRYDYFDPEARRYLAAVAAAIPIRVERASSVPMDSLRLPNKVQEDTPFPAIMRAIRAHPIVAGAVVVVVVFVILFIAIRGRTDPSGD
jgi:hypothetical protein